MGSDFFQIEEIGTELTFSLGGKSVRDFRMIEMHFFEN
jgi:hypothetical protein